MTDTHGMGLPFTEADFVGPEDRPRPSWELTMYEWQVYGNPTIKEYMDGMTGSVARAIQCAPKPEEGVIYVRACSPEAPKAHNLTISPDHRTVGFSLYTPLLAFEFPKVNANHKAIFKCRPEQYGESKILVIEVHSYRVAKVDKEAREQVAAAQETKPLASGETDPPAAI